MVLVLFFSITSSSNNQLYFISQDCPTRWGTKQKMVERILEQEQAIARVLVSDRKHQHLILKWQDKDVLTSLQESLKPVADFTDILSGERYVTVSSVKPVLQLLTCDLLKPNPNETDLTQNIKRKMSSVLEDKYSAPTTQELLAKSSFLDPRYRGNGGDGLEETRDALRGEIVSADEGNGGGVSGASEAATAGDDSGEVCAPPPTKKRNLGDLLNKRRSEISAPLSIRRALTQS